MSARAVALLSGGLDSATGLAMWLDSGHQVCAALTADYGQRSAAMEWQHSAALARRYGVPHHRLDLPWLADLARQSGSRLLDGDLPDSGDPEQPGDADSARAVWVPARNLVLLGIASAYAETLQADAVLVGFNREEAATFSDNSEAFVKAFNVAAELGTATSVAVESPTLQLRKEEVVHNARRLGISANDVWSCYDSGPQRCGKCESCRRSARAWGTTPAL